MLLSWFSQQKLLLILICALFLSTRLYKIAEIPVSVYWDEASIGYNAYSIIQTGKDEWGKTFPLHFRAFGEFKLPVYIYTAAVFIKIFGLNALAVRLPAVFFSLGVIILTYLLATKLSEGKQIGLLSSFFLSISPWFFIFSRTGYEVTAGLAFYLLAIYFFLINNKNIWYVFLSTVSFILSAYSYNSFRIIIPITILVLIIYYFMDLKHILKKGLLPLILSGVILIISIIPIYRLYVYDAGISRFQAVSTNKTSFIKNYLSHFSLDFLILSGDKNLRSQQAGFGQLYLPELIFILLGIVYLIKSKKKYRFLPLALLLLGPIPAAITKESPHALRAISSVPYISIIAASGVIYIRKFIPLRYVTELVVILISSAFFVNYFTHFLTSYPVQSSKDWQYGYKEIFTNYEADFNKYEQILVADEYAQPYIFALFYLKYDPNKFRQEVKRNSVDQWGFSTVAGFNKFKFGKTKQLVRDKFSQVLFASEANNTINQSALKKVKFLDGSNAFWVYRQ